MAGKRSKRASLLDNRTVSGRRKDGERSHEESIQTEYTTVCQSCRSALSRPPVENIALDSILVHTTRFHHQSRTSQGPVDYFLPVQDIMSHII